jgi:hypothetical protein
MLWRGENSNEPLEEPQVKDRTPEGRMPRREFASEKALQGHAKLTGDFYAWEATARFVKWQGLLSPDRSEIVDVRTSQGVRRAMLFPKAVLKAEWDAAAPLRDALAIRRERWRALRSQTKKRPSLWRG